MAQALKITGESNEFEAFKVRLREASYKVYDVACGLERNGVKYHECKRLMEEFDDENKLFRQNLRTANDLYDVNTALMPLIQVTSSIIRRLDQKRENYELPSWLKKQCAELENSYKEMVRVLDDKRQYDSYKKAGATLLVTALGGALWFQMMGFVSLEHSEERFNLINNAVFLASALSSAATATYGFSWVNKVADRRLAEQFELLGDNYMADKLKNAPSVQL